MSWGSFRPYVPVAQRRAKASAYARQVAKKEKRELTPVEVSGRNIANSFWGQAWCDNLESYSDFANRLPRGRTYVRNGSVIDLQIQRGKIKALVSGSEVYRVTIDISTLPPAAWKRIKKDCAGSVDSVMDLLQGKFDRGVMERLSSCDGGLFPKPREIAMSCTCPDWADMCKHVAATLYGVGARLDIDPELLFVLRNVDPLELVRQAADSIGETFQAKGGAVLDNAHLGEIFGIDLEAAPAAPTRTARAKAKPAKSPPRKGNAKRRRVTGKKKPG